MAGPAVSVCIPVYQGEQYVAETVASVLSQTFADFELVVLDNHCSDRTAEIVASIPDRRIRVEHNPMTLPLPDNWNRAVSLSRAPLVKVLCADDLLHPLCLERQVAALHRDRRIALVAARQHMIDRHTRILVPNRALQGLLGPHGNREVIRKVVRNGGNPIGCSAAVLYRRTHFDAVGGFAADNVFAMDIDLWVRLLEHGDFLGMREALSAFRVRAGSVSSSGGEEIYRSQRRFTTELSRKDLWSVPRRDRLFGALGARLARRRREALFGLARVTARAGH